jgi:hypothetical protein
MRYILLRHTVKDYDRWRPLYDADRAARKSVGLEELFVFRDSGDANQITILFRAKDVESARLFAEAPGLVEKLQLAGVMGKPEICVLNEA